MLYCIEVNRGGIGEENMVLHKEFEQAPTREDVLTFIEDQDCGYDDKYCSFTFFHVG